MHEEDRATVTLTEIPHQADASRRTVERANEQSSIFNTFPARENYIDIVITGRDSSYQSAICARFAWSEGMNRPVVAAASSQLKHVRTFESRDGSKATLNRSGL